MFENEIKMLKRRKEERKDGGGKGMI